MEREDFQRKLTAIMSADAVGYSRLMGDDEAATVSTLKHYRNLMAEIVLKYSGRIVDSPGDNVLSEFASIVDAVNCAVEIQHALKQENDALPEPRRMPFRIGVNLGDIIEDADRIYGDGVNIAARVERLASPGQVAISGAAFDSVRDKLDLGFESLGEHEVKNIKQPVRIYRVITDPAMSGRVIGEPKIQPAKTQRSVLTIAAVIVLVIAVIIFITSTRTDDTSSKTETASIETVNPSIAVLPFTNMSGDKAQEYFSDGITEDLITDLSKISRLMVIARNSTFSYKGKAVDVKQVAEDLGVRYVLEGSVRRSQDTVRINAQLIDARTGSHVWADRFDNAFGEIFSLQDTITRRIVAALAIELSVDEENSLSLRYTDNVEAYDKYLKGKQQFYSGTQDGFTNAVKYFEKAIALDPDFSPAHAGLAHTYQKGSERGFAKTLGWKDARAKMQTHIKLAMKNPTPYAHVVSAKSLLYKRKYDEAIAEAERGIAMDPNYPEARLLKGMILMYSGKSAEAVDQFGKGMKLDPQFPAPYLYYLGLSQYLLGEYEQAAASSEESLKLAPHYGPWPLAIARAQMNQGQQAADIMSAYFDKRGWKLGFIESTFRYWPFKQQEDLDLWAEGLRKSGMMRPWNPVYRREYDKALADAQEALTLNPSDPKAQYAMGESLVFAGRSAEAIGFLQKAMELDAKHPGYYIFMLGLAQFCLERYEEAAISLETSLLNRKMHPRPPMWLLAATYAHLGRQQDAERVLNEYLQKNKYTGYTIERVLKYYLHAFRNAGDTERFAEGLHKAGLPRS